MFNYQKSLKQKSIWVVLGDMQSRGGNGADFFRYPPMGHSSILINRLGTGLRFFF